MSINQARAEYYSMTAEEKEHFTANLCESIFFLNDALKERIIALMGDRQGTCAYAGGKNRLGEINAGSCFADFNYSRFGL